MKTGERSTTPSSEPRPPPSATHPLGRSSVRRTVAGAGRIVVKVGSAALAGADGGVDIRRLHRLMDSVVARHRYSDVVLASSGAILGGRSPLRLDGHPEDDHGRRVAASVGQADLISAYTASSRRHAVKVAQLLITEEDIQPDDHDDCLARAFEDLLRADILPIVNENDVAAQTRRWGNNDMLAVQVARVVHAEAVVFFSDVPGLLARDGVGGLTVLNEVDEDVDLTRYVREDLANPIHGTGGMTVKVRAIREATSAGIPVLLADIDQCDDVLRLGGGGTAFNAVAQRHQPEQFASRTRPCLVSEIEELAHELHPGPSAT